MKSLWETYLIWLEKRRRKRFEWWERKRAKGKIRFVMWATFMWGGSMTVLTSLTDYYFDGYWRPDRLPLKLIGYLVGGFLMGLFVWWSNERDYQQSLKGKSWF